mmetsp:Transcript_48915/g.97234  ORF Transcript_48915/g.97234 Transcript_48915/m.97234 type:complete len:167 (+) Transcript_48915:69-569(+)
MAQPRFSNGSQRHRSQLPRSRSRSRWREMRDELAREKREEAEIDAQVEAEVQNRVQERTTGAEFETALQEKLDEYVNRHFSLIAVELEMKKRRLIEDFKHQRETEERSRHELEEIIRVNQLRTQEQQQRAAQQLALQAQALSHERNLLQKQRDQRRKKIQQNLVGK